MCVCNVYVQLYVLMTMLSFDVQLEDSPLSFQGMEKQILHLFVPFLTSEFFLPYLPSF